MINGDIIFFVSDLTNEMLIPKQGKFKKFIDGSTKLIEVEYNNKIICLNKNRIFDTFLDAEIYGTILFIKKYYTFDPILFINEISEEYLQEANNKLNLYATKYPDKFLYYYMSMDI